MCDHCTRNWLGLLNIKWGGKATTGFIKLRFLIFMYNEYYDPSYYDYKFKSNKLYSKWNRCNVFKPKEFYNKRYRL